MDYRDQLQQAITDAQSAVNAKDTARAAEQAAKRERSARMFAPVASCLNSLASELPKDKEVEFVDDRDNGRYRVHLQEKGWSLVRQHYIVSVEFRDISNKEFGLWLHGGLELIKGEVSLDHFLGGRMRVVGSGVDFGPGCEEHLVAAVIALIAAFKANKRRHELDFSRAAELIFKQFSDAISPSVTRD